MSNEQDVAKLHSEINQYINQYFTISMTGITALGIIGNWILAEFINSTSKGIQPEVKPITFLLSILLVIILFVLLYVFQMTDHKLHIIAAYLRKKQLSQWELDYDQFYEKSKSLTLLRGTDQGKSLISLFLILGIIAFFLPIILWMVFGFQNSMPNWITCGFHFFISFLYVITAYMTYCKQLFRFPKEDVEKLWYKIINSQKENQDSDKNRSEKRLEGIPVVKIPPEPL